MPNTATSVSQSDNHGLSPVILAVATTPERRVIERSNIDAYGAALLQTGIGPEQVRSISGDIRMCRPAGLISIGTAGGLTRKLLPGRLLLPKHVVTENGQVFPVTSPWHTRVCQRLGEHDIETGTIVSVARPVRRPHDKQRLQSSTGAVAVDMESAELAHIALQHSIPFLVVRAVADPLDQPLPRSAIAALTSRGNLYIAGLLGQLLHHPGEITALIRLNANFQAACRTLDACCRAAGEQMSFPDT